MKCMIQSYIDRMLTNNLLFHMEFYKALQAIQKSKTDEEIMCVYKYIKYVYNNNKLDLLPRGDMMDMHLTCDDVNRIVSLLHHEVPALKSLKDALCDNAYALVTFTYMHILKGTDFDTIIGCVNFLLEQKQKDIFKSSHAHANIDVLDILFNVITHIATTIHEHVSKYVLISKELMYFKTSRKHILERKRLLHGAIYVLFTKNISTRTLKKPMPSRNINREFMYLYTLCERDDEAINMVMSSLNQGAAMAREYTRKKLQIQDSFCPSHGKQVEIVKMSL